MSLTRTLETDENIQDVSNAYLENTLILIKLKIPKIQQATEKAGGQGSCAQGSLLVSRSALSPSGAQGTDMVPGIEPSQQCAWQVAYPLYSSVPSPLQYFKATFWAVSPWGPEGVWQELGHILCSGFNPRFVLCGYMRYPWILCEAGLNQGQQCARQPSTPGPSASIQQMLFFIITHLVLCHQKSSEAKNSLGLLM